MKKTTLIICLLLCLISIAKAQISKGGIPESMQTNKEQAYIPVNTSILPDWESFKKQEAANVVAGISNPFVIALLTPSDIRFPESGIFTELSNGKKVWRSQLKIEGAPAIGMYYDQFSLPQGVKYYITNNNGVQLLGAFTHENNNPSGAFASEAVQGNVVNLEINIEAGVNINDIKLHIDRSAVYFRSYEYLNQYADPIFLASEMDSGYDGGSSICMINAICPLGNNNAIQRKATVQVLMMITLGGITALSPCSGTMVNVVANTPENCKQYLLTASHCNPNNDTLSSQYDQALIRFNFERALCTGGIIPEAKTMTGADFVSRSIITSISEPTNIKGDFLLLELRDRIPDDWNVTMNGWNNDPNIPLTTTAPEKFIGFHHPAGDNKKVSSSHILEHRTFGMPSSHWRTQLDSGYAEGGSSGSGLFDGAGRQIGVLSSGTASSLVPGACEITMHGDPADPLDILYYSKFSLIWDYAIDGDNPRRKLKPWLDPENTGAITINPVNSNCTPIEHSAIKDIQSDWENAVVLSPNPTNDGKITARINLEQTTDLSAHIYDANGRKMQSVKLKNVKTGTYAFDLSNYANGMYIIIFSNQSTSVSKKVMLTK